MAAAPGRRLWRTASSTHRTERVGARADCGRPGRFLRSDDCPWRADFDAFEAQCRGGALGAATGRPGDRKLAQAVFEECLGQAPDVFERLVADKQKDGVLDERVFARKVRGTSGPVIEMRDRTGRVLLRGRTITRW